MQSLNCSGCGAPLTPGAQFCTYCGTAAPQGAAAPVPPTASPLPSGAPPASFPPTAGPEPAAAPAPRRRSLGLIVIVLVVVMVIVLSVTAYAFLTAPVSAPVRVGALEIWAPDHVCDLNATPNLYYYGFNSSTSTNVIIDVLVPNFNASTCTVHGVSTNTTGFTVQGTPLPLSIAAASNASMNLTISTPSSSYSGNVNLVFT